MTEPRQLEHERRMRSGGSGEDEECLADLTGSGMELTTCVGGSRRRRRRTSREVGAEEERPAGTIPRGFVDPQLAGCGLVHRLGHVACL